MPTVALLEDEEALREEIADFLSHCGYQVLQAGSQGTLAPLAAARRAILGAMLTDGTGFDAVRLKRQHSQRAGLVTLTAFGTLNDRPEGLGSGADYYLVMPSRLLEQ